MSVLYLYHVTVQYFPVLDPTSPYFFRIGRLGESALYHCFSTIKAVDRKKYPNEKITTSTKRNVKLNKILDRIIRNIEIYME